MVFSGLDLILNLMTLNIPKQDNDIVVSFGSLLGVFCIVWNIRLDTENESCLRNLIFMG